MGKLQQDFVPLGLIEFWFNQDFSSIKWFHMIRYCISLCLVRIQSFIVIQIDGQRRQVLCDFTHLKKQKTRIPTKQNDWCIISNHMTYVAGVNPILVFMLQYQVMIIFMGYTCQIMSLAGVDGIFSDIWQIFVGTVVFDGETQWEKWCHDARIKKNNKIVSNSWNLVNMILLWLVMFLYVYYVCIIP